LRLGLDADYDRIQELANQHKTVRQMLGHSDWLDEQRYELQTIRDNVSLFTPEILDRINQVVVHAGHQALKKNAEESLKARADSFVVKTHVHFPTDINLLWDAIRKTLRTCAEHCAEHCSELCDALDLTEWRQSAYHLRCFKKNYRLIQKLKHSTSQDEAKKLAKQVQIKAAYQTTLDQAETIVRRASATRQCLNRDHGVPTLLLADLDTYLMHAERQIDQIRRRVLQDETIPHAEKVFSLFQPHTEWISKGKAGVPFELGLRVCIVEDQHRFILHHLVMEKTTDAQIAVALVEQTQARFAAVKAMSFDKGFHSPSNQTELKQHLENVILPKKGRLSEADKARESDPEFVRLRRQHSAVESAINALGVHGLDKCPDHGIDGFKRYVALATVARNIQRLGAILREQEQQATDRRRGPYKKAA
jgi:transposase, IS5 family